MLLNLSEDQEFFRETTDRFLNEQVPPDAVRALRHDETGFDPHLLAPRRRAGVDLVAGRRGARRRHHQRRRTGRPEPRRLRLRAPRGARTARRDQRGGGGAQRARRGPRRAGLPALGRGDRHLVRPAVRARRLAADRRGQRPTAPTWSCAARRARSRRPRRRTTCSSPATPATAAPPRSWCPPRRPGITVAPMQTVDLTRRFSSVTFDDVRRPRPPPWERRDRRRPTSTVSSWCSSPCSTPSRSVPCRPGST